MTTYLGNSGVVKIGSNSIAELTNFDLTVKEGTAEDTAQGDTAHTRLPDGLQDWEASINGHYYPGDTNGQALLIEGASLSFVFNLIGTTTGYQKFSGTGIVTQVKYGSSENGKVVDFAASVMGAGAIARGVN